MQPQKRCYNRTFFEIRKLWTRVFLYYLTIHNNTYNSLYYSIYVPVTQNIQYLQPDFWKLTHNNDPGEPWKKPPHTTSTFHHKVSTLLLNPSMPYRKSNKSFVNHKQEQDGKYYYSTHEAECPSWAPGSVQLADEHGSKNPCSTSRSC